MDRLDRAQSLFVRVCDIASYVLPCFAMDSDSCIHCTTLGALSCSQSVQLIKKFLLKIVLQNDISTFEINFFFRAVGMPRMEQVTVRNTDRKNNLHLLSISGSTAHFHCSFFQDKVSI